MEVTGDDTGNFVQETGCKHGQSTIRSQRAEQNRLSRNIFERLSRADDSRRADRGRVSQTRSRAHSTLMCRERLRNDMPVAR
jgi:hypothetical protein